MSQAELGLFYQRQQVCVLFQINDGREALHSAGHKSLQIHVTVYGELNNIIATTEIKISRYYRGG